MQASGNLLEAAHAADVAATRHPHPEWSDVWRHEAKTLREAGLRSWRYVVEDLPHGAPNLLPLGVCTRPEQVSHCINGLGQVVLSTMEGGVLYTEILDPVTSRVVRRGILDTGTPGQPWLVHHTRDALLLGTTQGRCVLVDDQHLTPLRDFQAPLPENYECYRLMVPQPDLLWLLSCGPGETHMAWRIFDLETVRPVGTCGSEHVDAFVCWGLEPPGILLQGSGVDPRFVTPRGRPHGLSQLPPGLVTTAVLALPFDRHVACVFGNLPEKEAMKPAMVPIRRPGSSGPKGQMSWATPALSKWHCATPAFERGELLAIGQSAENVFELLVVRPTQYKIVDTKINSIANNSALAGTWDGRKAYLLAGLAGGLRIFTDPLSLGDSGGKFAIRPVFPARMPGYPQTKIENTEPCKALLARVMRRWQPLPMDELDRLWAACEVDSARLMVFGRLVHVQALSVAEALRPKVEQLAETSVRAALLVVGLDCALERFDAALAGWQAIDLETLDAEEARHHRHLRAYIAIMQGDLDDGIARLDIQTVEPQTDCGCAVKYWREAAEAVRAWQAGATQPLLAELLGALASAEADIEAGRSAEVRAAWAHFVLDGEPNTQSSARLALAWLRDPAERTADDRFQEAVTLAVFLTVQDRTESAYKDHLLVPGQHWPRARIETLAAEAAVRHAEILAGYFGAT